MERRFNARPIVAAILAASLLAGCAMTPKPPNFNLYERQSLTILPFENHTRDEALASEIQDELLAGLLRLDAVPLTEAGQVMAFLQQSGQHAGPVEQNAGLRTSIANEFNSDVILVGSVTTYVESDSTDQPRRMKTSYGSDTYKWGYYRSKQVKVTATIKLVDAATGQLLWVRKGTGSGTSRSWIDLPYPGTNTAPPAEGWSAFIAAAESGGDYDGHPGKGKGHAKHGESAAQPVININITNSNTQSQTATASASASASAGAQGTQTVLLYHSDPTFASLRSRAIRSAVNDFVRDFRGRGGWTPDMQNIGS